MELIDKILTEWAYRVHDGMPNPKNPLHIVKLQESLDELNLPRKVTEKLLQNLREEDWWGKLSPEEQSAYIKAHPKSKKAQDAKKEIEKAKKEPTEKSDTLKSLHILQTLLYI